MSIKKNAAMTVYLVKNYINKHNKQWLTMVLNMGVTCGCGFMVPESIWKSWGHAIVVLYKFIFYEMYIHNKENEQ